MKVQLLLIVPLLLAGLARADSKNLLSGGDMEGAGPKGLPPQWTTLIIGPAATIASDRQTRHDGAQSIRIRAAESTRAYARSVDPVAVAPGEKLIGSFWVRCADVPTGKGAVIAIAEFSDLNGGNESVAKFDVAKIPQAARGWQHIAGSIKTPDGAANLRIRLGFSYSKGTCWWDDAAITAAQPIVARIAIPSDRLLPSMKTLPVDVINREGRRADARVTVMLGKSKTEASVRLNGQPIQRVDVPVTIQKRGKEKLSAEVFIGGPSTTSFTEKREVNVPPAVVLAPPSPTHWVSEDGPPSIEGRIDLALNDAQRVGATLEVRVVDAGAGAATRATWRSNSTVDGIQRFTIKPPATLPQGSYRLIAELKPASGAALKVEQPWSIIPRRLAEVTLNVAGYPVYDGKAILPLGLFNGGRFKEQASAGFTVTHAYNAARIHNPERPEDEYALSYLNGSAENGMKMLLMIPMKQAIDGKWDVIRQRVRMFRNHPALLAWDEEEGFARGDFKPDTLKKIRQIITEEDPHHPLMVGDAREVITRIPPDRANLFPTDEMDMGMWWWYPLPLGAKKGEALEGEEMSQSDEMAPPSFLINATTHKPIWVGVQSYKKKKSRFPTPTEYRAQAYIALIHGAKGLMWYGGSVTGGIFSAPEKKTDPPSTEQGHWEALKAVVREVSDLAPVIMGSDEPAPTVSPAGAPISVRIKRAGGRVVLLAANRGNNKASIELASALIPAGAVNVLNEHRTAPAHEGRLVDEFAPYAVHVYELSK
jgi:hypothetical protein